MKMALERLEPCAMKVARTVLRRVVTGDSHGLSDTIGFQTTECISVAGFSAALRFVEGILTPEFSAVWSYNPIVRAALFAWLFSCRN
jgi:hypothetical protein